MSLKYYLESDNKSWQSQIKEYLKENNLHGIIIGGAALSVLSGSNKLPKDVDIVVDRPISSSFDMYDTLPLFKNNIKIDLIELNKEIFLKDNYGSFTIKTQNVENYKTINGLKIINEYNLFLTAKNSETREKIIKDLKLPFEYFKKFKDKNDKIKFVSSWIDANNISEKDEELYINKFKENVK